MAYPILDRRALPNGANFSAYEKAVKQNEGPFGLGSGWAGEIVGRPTSAALDVFGSTATGLGFNNAADVLHSGADYFNERLKTLKSFDGSMDYFTSPNGLFGNFLNLTGSQLALLAPTLAKMPLQTAKPPKLPAKKVGTFLETM